MYINYTFKNESDSCMATLIFINNKAATRKKKSRKSNKKTKPGSDSTSITEFTFFPWQILKLSRGAEQDISYHGDKLSFSIERHKDTNSTSIKDGDSLFCSSPALFGTNYTFDMDTEGKSRIEQSDYTNKKEIQVSIDKSATLAESYDIIWYIGTQKIGMHSHVEPGHRITMYIDHSLYFMPVPPDSISSDRIKGYPPADVYSCRRYIPDERIPNMFINQKDMVGNGKNSSYDDKSEKGEQADTKYSLTPSPRN